MKTRPNFIEPLETRIAPATLYALTSAGTILVFDSSSPGQIDETLTITGIGAGETVLGLDFRPATGELIASTAPTMQQVNAIASTYRINIHSGEATLIGSTAAGVAGWGTVDGGYDFNPVPDRIRIQNINDENARLNPGDGALSGNDTDITPGASTSIIGSAYDRSFAGTTASTLFAIDRDGNELVRIGGVDGSPSPNGGVATSIGALGITLDANFDAGFDVEGKTGIAYAALRDDGTDQTGLYTINLTTGAATLVGTIGDGSVEIRGLSALAFAPTIIDSKTARWTDLDGDIVTLKITRGDITDAVMKFNIDVDSGVQLKVLDFGGDAQFQGTKVIVSVEKAGQGDGRTAVGSINATGIDLGAVKIAGDLGEIDAGDATTSTAAVKSITARSFGSFHLTTGATNLESTLVGGLGKLSIKGDVSNVHLNVTGGADGRIGSVFIGGSLIGGGDNNSGRISAEGDITSVEIRRNIVGGDGTISGSIVAIHGETLVIGGSIVGGNGSASGLVEFDTLELGIVGKDILGGGGTNSGQIAISDTLGKIQVNGDVIGGLGSSTGGITADDGAEKVVVAGSIHGGSGGNSGRVISTQGDLDNVKIGGSLYGGTGGNSGAVSADEGALGKIRIGGGLYGGSLASSATSNLSNSGRINGQSIGSVFIGGSVVGGSDDNATFNLDRNAILTADDSIGSVTIMGDFVGRATVDGVTNPFISARGQAVQGDTTDLAIGSIFIGGRVELALILAGYTVDPSASNPDAQIGSVTVGGDWIASSIVAGVKDDASLPLNDFFGDADDELISGGDVNIVSRIGSIVIKGQVTGTLSSTDSYAFTAQQIGSVKIGKTIIPLTDATDAPFTIATFTGDVFIKEL